MRWQTHKAIELNAVVVELLGVNSCRCDNLIEKMQLMLCVRVCVVSKAWHDFKRPLN